MSILLFWIFIFFCPKHMTPFISVKKNAVLCLWDRAVGKYLHSWLIRETHLFYWWFCLCPVWKDWEYLLGSHYHRQMNSQSVCGPLESSGSNNSLITDAEGMSSVSNLVWLDWYITCRTNLIYSAYLGVTIMKMTHCAWLRHYVA